MHLKLYHNSPTQLVYQLTTIHHSCDLSPAAATSHSLLLPATVIYHCHQLLSLDTATRPPLSLDTGTCHSHSLLSPATHYCHPSLTTVTRHSLLSPATVSSSCHQQMSPAAGIHLPTNPPMPPAPAAINTFSWKGSALPPAVL